MWQLLMAKFPCYNSRHQQRNLDQHVTVNPPSSCKKMPGWVVRTHPPMIKLVFWKLSENRVFLWECCSAIFCQGCLSPNRMFILCCLSPLWLIALQDAYLLESLLRVYIWVRKYGIAVLVGPIVIIAAHRVAKQSWPFWCQLAVVRKVFRRWTSPQFMTLNIWDVSGDLRRLGNVLSNVSCIKDEWQFKRLGRQCCQSYLFNCGRKWIQWIASV